MRNEDINNILEKTELPSCERVKNCQDTFVGGGDGSRILDHEICIVNGDLNYRIDTMSRDAVITAVRNNNLTKLLERDQLLVSRRRYPGLRLRAFREASITFDPTYKYDVGTDNYDTSEKKRAPAWCDRILHRDGLNRNRIKQHNYVRHEVRASDHRAVSAAFEVTVKSVIPEKKKGVEDQCLSSFADVKAAYRKLAK
jgi:hypothetical protein